MANTIKNIGGVARELLYQLTNELSVIKGIKRQYSDQFAKEGAKVGETLNVKWIENTPVTRGSVAVINNYVEKTMPIIITNNHQYQSAIEFSDTELKLSVEDFNAKTNLKQIAASIANEMEEDVLKLALQVPNNVGTVGATPGTVAGAGLLMQTSPNIYGNAGAVLTELGAPTNNRTMVVNSAAMTLSASATVALQNPAVDISGQYRKGVVTRAMNFDFVENVNIPTITTGTRAAAGTVLVGSTDGDTTLQVTGLGAGATVSLGEHFTVAGVNAVNPMNQQARFFLRMFVVTAAATANAAGQATLSVSPQIILSNPEKMVGGTLTRRYPGLPINVNGTVDALPLAGAVVTFSGAASTVAVLNLAHQHDAIVLTSVNLPIHGDAEKCVVVSHEGISLRVWQASNWTNGTTGTRIDAIMVPTLVRPDLATVVFG
jgi:hypothetical protein